MNFIKKKLKSHKKDDEEEEYEKAVYEQSLHSQNPDQKMKSTEEWQFFQQLSMRVQDTVQKTQTTLNKLKDTHQEDEDDDSVAYDVDGELLSKDIPSYGKVLRAPPRPPPPSSEKAGMSSDLDFGSDLNHSSPAKGPPRPPPPVPSEIPFSFDSSALHGTPSKSFGSPARPPPPNTVKIEHTLASENYSATSDSKLSNINSEKQSASFSLLDEFGFSSDTITSTAPTNVQDLLFLDDKEVDDPFDTSFVDVNNPISVQIPSDRKNSGTDKSFNPFASSTASNDWSIGVEKSKSSVTNPFFCNVSNEVKTDVHHDKEQSVSSHNPFNFNSSVSAHEVEDDLFGLNILPSSSKNKLTDLFNSNKDSSKLVNESDNLSSLIGIEPIQFNSKINGNLDLDNTLIQANSDTLAKEDDQDIWHSDQNDFTDILSTNMIKSGDLSTTTEKTVENSLFWDSNSLKADVLLPEKPVMENESNFSESKENKEIANANGSKPCDDFIINTESSSFPLETESKGTLQPKDNDNLSSTVDDILQSKVEEVLQPKDDISQPKAEDNFQTKNEDIFQSKDDDTLQPNDEYILQSQDENSILKSKDEDFLQSNDEDILQSKDKNILQSTVEDVLQHQADNVLEHPAVLEPQVDILQPQTDVLEPQVDILQHQTDVLEHQVGSIHHSVEDLDMKSIEKENHSTDSFIMQQNQTGDLNLDTFSSSSVFNETKTEVLFEATNEFESKQFENERTETFDQINAQFDSGKFSKPFEEENEDRAFLFKVKAVEKQADIEFDAFSAKFENAKDNQGADAFDPFANKRAPTLKKLQENYKGFDSMDEFDPFKVTAKPEEPQNIMKKEPSRDSFEDYDNEVDFSVVIRPKVKDSADVKLPTMEPPKLLPPPKTPTKAFDIPASRFNPFDKDFLENTEVSKAAEKSFPSLEIEEEPVPALGEAGVRKDSVETPLSPLFDEDTSLPLEIYPKPFGREGWEMVLRQPNKKKLTGNRFWKKIFVKLSENSVLQLFNKSDDKLPFQELPLQACYSLSEIGAQQYDQYGKIFTVKLQYKFYRERVGVRPGQISKVTQGQVTSMGDVAKLGLPLQHSPQTSQLLKLGSQSYTDIQLFIQEVEDALFRMVVHRDRVLTYKTEEVQVVAQDEFYVEQSKTGHVDKQLARVRIFFLAFITGMPSVEVGLNDIIRQGKEVVGRYDIIPVVTEEWIRLEDCEFHSCVEQDEFHKSRVIKFHPPDACLFELLRFRIRPPKNRELPLQVRVFMTVSDTRVEIRSDILVPGYSSRKQGQVPCENIQIRFPVPECWIYLFRTEKHFRYGSKKSTARRPGKIKGLERIIGAAQNLDPSLIEVSAGQAKYEHVFHAVVWRIPRLPKEGQGAYTQQLFLLRTELTSFDQIPETFDKYVDVEFTMPATYVSHTTVRSVSVTNPVPPEKYVKYISKHEYKVEIDFKNSSDEIDGLISSPSVNAPVSTAPAVQESTEDEEKDDDSD